MPSSEALARGDARPRARRGLRLAVTLAALPCGLLLCEAYVRARGLAPLPSPVRRGDDLMPDEDPVLRYVPHPGGVQTVRLVDRPGGSPRIVEAHVNEQGFRGPPVAPAPADGVLRIACVGDSHTFGFGVGDLEPWPAVLARELESALGPGRVEVVNTGVNGYDAEQEAIWLERGVLPIAPGLVVWQYFLNDVAMREQELAPGQEPGFWMRALAPRAGGLVGWLRDVSRAADLVADRIYRRLSFDLYGDARDDLYADDHPAWARVRAALLRAHAACAERQVEMLVVLFPYLHEKGGRLASHDALAKVASFCRREGIAVLDLEPDFAGRDVAPLRVHALDYHFGPEAHAIAGRRIAAALLASGGPLAQ